MTGGPYAHPSSFATPSAAAVACTLRAHRSQREVTDLRRRRPAHPFGTMTARPWIFPSWRRWYAWQGRTTETNNGYVAQHSGQLSGHERRRHSHHVEDRF